MSTEANKTPAHRANTEGLNQKNLAIVDDLCASDLVFHHASMTIQGLEAYKHLPFPRRRRLLNISAKKLSKHNFGGEDFVCSGVSDSLDDRYNDWYR